MAIASPRRELPHCWNKPESCAISSLLPRVICVIAGEVQDRPLLLHSCRGDILEYHKQNVFVGGGKMAQLF